MITIDMIDEFSEKPEKLDNRRKNEASGKDKAGSHHNGKKRKVHGKDSQNNLSSSREPVKSRQGLAIHIRRPWAISPGE